MTKHVMAAALMCAAPMLGCGDDETSGTTTPVDGVTYSGKITDAALGSPIAEAEICGVDPVVACVQADGDGNYTLPGLPKNSDVLIRASRPGYFTAQAIFVIGDADRSNVNSVLFDEDVLSSIYTDAGLTFDKAKGHIGVVLTDPGPNSASGYTVSVSPASGDGPYYLDGTAINTGLSATSDSGTAAFANMDDGDYTVTVSGADPCTDDLVKGNGDGTYPAKVEGGIVYYVTSECVDQPGGGSGGAGGSSSSGSGGSGGN
jgi:hypothetical protein